MEGKLDSSFHVLVTSKYPLSQQIMDRVGMRPWKDMWLEDDGRKIEWQILWCREKELAGQ